MGHSFSIQQSDGGNVGAMTVGLMTEVGECGMKNCMSSE